MNKKDFLNTLRARLSGLPEEDIEERLSFYSEMIDDRMEDGVTEEDAVAGIGSVDMVVDQIMSEIPLPRLVKSKVSAKRKLKTWEIVLLVLGSPVWVPLLIAAIAVVFSLYVVLWAVVVCFYAADLALAAGAAAGLFIIAVYLKAGNPAGAVFSLGTSMVCAGLAILFFFICKWMTKVVIRLTGRMLLGIKASFVGREA